MKDFVKTLAGIAITAGLSDRTGFVKNVEEIIKQYQDDPATAEKWSKVVVDYLQNFRDNVNLQHAVKGAFADNNLPDKQNIEDLTQAIRELSNQLKEKQHS